jgi:exonuclease III
MTKPLKIITWNANRLAKHSQEIKTFIFNQNIYILLVSETRFTNKSYCRIYCITQFTLTVELTEELHLS